MKTITLNPITDERYRNFVASHPDATIFHSQEWLTVLAETYGFLPGCIAIDTNGELAGALPYMEIRGITGKRKRVSLPFSDFCEPLFDNKKDFREVFDTLIEQSTAAGCHNMELRGGKEFLDSSHSCASIFTHNIDLSADAEFLFKNIRPSVQRNIHKAERCGLSVSFENNDAAISKFYRLNCITRKTHGLPPQPYSFFRKLNEQILSHGNGFITSVFMENKTIASSIFLVFNNKAFYKYGASDPLALAARPNDLMMWKSIIRCREMGCQTLSLGRTETHHTGLLQFKHGWNSVESEVLYYNFHPHKKVFVHHKQNKVSPVYTRLFSVMPVSVLRLIGNTIYRFAG